MGFVSSFIRSRRRLSTADSPRPNTRRVRERITPSLRRASQGTARSRNMGRHSLGGPGSMTTQVPSASKAQPGAVPQALSRIWQSSGRYACWRLLSVISFPMRWKKQRMPSAHSGW